MEGLNAIQVCIRDLWLVVSPNVSMWNIEHLFHDKSRTYLCDVKFRTFWCDSYQSCLLEIPAHSVDINSSKLCTDARGYLSFSLSLHCLALFLFHINVPGKHFKLIIDWNTFEWSTSLFHLKGCTQYIQVWFVDCLRERFWSEKCRHCDCCAVAHAINVLWQEYRRHWGIA